MIVIDWDEFDDRTQPLFYSIYANCSGDSRKEFPYENGKTRVDNEYNS
jgi:hypothetical protein